MSPARALQPLFLLAACLLAGAAASGQTPPQAQSPAAPEPLVRRPLPARKTTAPPAIDGDLSDAAWTTAPRAAGFQDRAIGGPAPDQTEAWLLYDEKYIYVAFLARDARPDQITGRETVRDHRYNSNSGESEDSLEVSFDPFRSNRFNDLARFSVNPLGTLSARITGGRAGKAEWKGDWDAAVKRVPEGWTAEMRIPWAILSYPSSAKPVDMGVNFSRFQYRTRVESVWSNIGPQYFLDQQGVWTGIEVPRGTFRPTLSLLPYVIPGLRRDEAKFRSGLDARYTLTPELTGVGTINPDFATIEGAVEGIYFSRSERFIPERRPFFLEGRDFFQAGESFSIGPYFYSQRIQTVDVGAKFFGKLTPKDSIGILQTLDIGDRGDLVARYRRDLGPTHGAGLFVTSRAARDDNNTAAFLMHNIRWGKLGLDTHVGMTAGRGAGGGAQHVNLTYEDRFGFTSLLFHGVAPNYRNANGLNYFNDYRGFQAYQTWGTEWRRGFWREFNVEFYPSYDWHYNGKPFRRGAGFDVGFTTRSDWRLGIGTNQMMFDDQRDSTYSFRIRHGVSNRFRQWGLRMTTGTLADKPYTFIGPEFSVRVLKRLDLAYGGAVQSLDGRTQQHIGTMNYEISPTRSIGGRVVTADHATNWYVSYRNSGERGTETYFILGDPNARRFTEQVLLKLVFAR
jgi:hypothetical protein